MKALNYISVIVAFVLGAGEIARWWGDMRFLPLAFDELLVAAALFAAVLFGRKAGAVPFVAAWGLYCGLVLSLLVPTLDHLLFGPPKESAVFYSIILSALLSLGVWALLRSVCLSLERKP